MRNLLTISIFLAAVLLISCRINCDAGDHNFSISNDQLTVKNSVTLSGSLFDHKLEIDLGSADVTLGPSPDDDYHVDIVYMEHELGDSRVFFERSKLRTTTKSKFQPRVVSVTGTVPVDTELIVHTGSGDLTISGLNRSQALDLQTGSGDLTLKSITGVSLVNMQNGSGDLKVIDSSLITTLHIQAGSGDIQLSGIHNMDNFDAIQGSGDSSFNDVDAKFLKIYAGSGDIRLTGCKIAEFDGMTGSGDLYLDRSKIDRRTFRTGSGETNETGHID
jgi:DUF4097 and DUF4098 domain-containing protein YvlB